MLRRRILFAGLFLLMLALIGGTAHQLGRPAWLASHEQQLRGLIAQSPLVAWCLGGAVYFGLSYAAGASGVPLASFWWTTHVGILPGTIVFAVVGAQIPSLNVLVEKGVWELADPRLLVGLAALGLLPWLIRPILRRLVFN